MTTQSKENVKRIQPIVLTNLDSKKIITKIDYDEECDIYRVIVKLKHHKRTRK